MPATLAPQLASLASAAPTSGAWSWEIKLDGYRLMARIEDGNVRLITRGGHDWSAKMPALVKALQSLKLKSTWLDGEIVVLGKNGTPEFNALQNAFDRSRTDAIDYFLFDLPYFEGHDLRATPLVQRRQLLKQLLDDHPHEQLRFSADFDADAASILESARRMGLEGVIAKRKDAPYESRRTETWLKLKNKLRQEFVVAGYTDRSSGEAQIGSLLLGVHDDGGQLVYVGNVGTGWNAKTAAELKTRLKKMEVTKSPFGAKPLHQHRWAVRDPAAQHFVETDARRRSRVLGLDTRQPGAARQVPGPAHRQGGEDREARKRGHAAGPGAGEGGQQHRRRHQGQAPGTHHRRQHRHHQARAGALLRVGGRVDAAAPERPAVLSGARAQRRGRRAVLPEAHRIAADHRHQGARRRAVARPRTAAGGADGEGADRRGADERDRVPHLEFDGAKIDQPDRVIFDLDPGEGESWPRVQEAATLVRGLLQELGLQSWLKTSGGKGLHVVVPLTPRDDWDTVKAFAQAAVQHLAQVIPQRFSARMGAANRVGKIFVDYLRNNHGATTAAAFSARSRPGLGVSMPIAWDDLPALKRSDQWTVRTAREHLSFQTADPWRDYWTCKQTLTKGLKALGLSPSQPRTPAKPPRSRARSARA